MPDLEELEALAADALKGFTVMDDEGCGWPLDKSERAEAAKLVIAAIKDKLNA